MKQLLVTDDDIHHRSLLNHFMTRQGYRVIEARDGVQAIEVLREQAIDLAIVDVMMPKVDGWTLCAHIRDSYDIPIIMLTARDQLADKERGFLSGADDYMTKPYELPELLFRVKALFRRYLVPSSGKIRLGELVVDLQNYEVIDGDNVIVLPLKEFELLAQMAQYPGRLFSRDDLIRLVWGQDYAGDERTVDVHIKRLRQRFVGSGRDFAIHTVRGIGYKIEVPGL